jgi:hypothetical protein
MGASHTVDLTLRTDEDGDLHARGTVGGHEVLVTTAGDGLIEDVDALVPVGDDTAASGPRVVGEGEERRYDGVALRHAHRRVEITDEEGRRVALDASADTPAVGVQVRDDDGEFDQYVGRVDETPRRLRFDEDGVSYGTAESVVDRAADRLPDDAGRTDGGREVDEGEDDEGRGR